MIKRLLFIISSLFIISCKTSSNIILYKDKNLLTTPIYPSGLDYFPWAYKSENIFDFIIFKGKRKEQLYTIISKLENNKKENKSIYNPRYAFILDFNNKRDTLYFSDFNNEDYEKKGFLIQNNLEVIDKNESLKKFLLENYKEFIQKEYYYIPNDKKEYHYQKEHNNGSLQHDEIHGGK